MESLVLKFSRLGVHPQKHICLACRTFSSTVSRAAAPKRRKRDPYREAQAHARKAAHLSRQEQVQRRRKHAAGDPVSSNPTPFIRALDNADELPRSALRSSKIPRGTTAQAKEPVTKYKVASSSKAVGVPEAKQDIDVQGTASKTPETATVSPDSNAAELSVQEEKQEGLGGANRTPTNQSDPQSESAATTTASSQAPREPAQSVSGVTKESRLNFFLRGDDLEQALARSKIYKGQRSHDYRSRMMEGLESLPYPRISPLTSHAPRRDEHERVTEALKRITSLDLSTSKDRLRINKARCVEVFGRHQTDLHLPEKPAQSSAAVGRSRRVNLGKTPRAGPDTGSSEVQIAILTARIKTLSQFLATRGKKDKMNKRNLRLLVHKRQKLLRYLERKERGGPRFRNVIDVLGLTTAAWKGEITLR